MRSCGNIINFSRIWKFRSNPEEFELVDDLLLHLNFPLTCHFQMSRYFKLTAYVVHGKRCTVVPAYMFIIHQVKYGHILLILIHIVLISCIIHYTVWDWCYVLRYMVIPVTCYIVYGAFLNKRHDICSYVVWRTINAHRLVQYPCLVNNSSYVTDSK